jgi:hypothetical protein
MVQAAGWAFPGKMNNTLLQNVFSKGSFVNATQTPMRSKSDNLCMLRFTFLRPAEVRLAPEHRAQYLTIREVVKWEVTDETGDYSGLLIVGEHIIGVHPPPTGFMPDANMTIDFRGRDLSPAKLHELCQAVRNAFFDPHCGWRMAHGGQAIQ